MNLPNPIEIASRQERDLLPATSKKEDAVFEDFVLELHSMKMFGATYIRAKAVYEWNWWEYMTHEERMAVLSHYLRSAQAELRQFRQEFSRELPLKPEMHSPD